MQTNITAHSGCEGTAENSIAHIQCALQCGVEALEIDVHPGAGEQFYLSHDPVESTGTCPSLEDAFSLLRGTNVKINCDLKARHIEHQVLKLARQWGIEQQLIFSGFVSKEALKDPEIRSRTLWNVEEVVPDIYQCSNAADVFEKMQTVLSVCQEHGVSVINICYELCTPEILEACRQAGIQISAWTVDEESWADTLLTAGIYNLTTRKPKMIQALRENRRGSSVPSHSGGRS